MRNDLQTTLIENISRKEQELDVGTKYPTLAVIGLSAGMIVACGLFIFVIELGVVSDFADRTPTQATSLLYEDSVALGGILANISGCSTYPYPVGIYWQQCSGFLVEYLWDAGRWHLQKC